MSSTRWTLLELLLHGVIIAVPFVLLFVLALARLAPSGVFLVTAGALERSPYINRILPVERAPGNDDGSVSLVEDPAYFTVDIPDGAYSSVDVALTFENAAQPVFELGALTDVVAQQYDLRPLDNRIIDGIDDWTRNEDDGRVLLARSPDYESIDAFLAAPPSRTRLATYHDDLDTPYREADYRPLGTTQTIDASLRGHHVFATYIKDETLDVAAWYMDMNRTEGRDDGVLRVWNERGEAIAETRLVDDGRTNDGQESSPKTEIRVTVPGLDEGVYKIELSGTSDIFWRTIVTPQRYVAFLDRLYIGDDVGYRSEPRATLFVTTAKHVTIETFHADSPQAVVIGGETIALPESHEKVQHAVSSPGLVSASTPVGDVKITGSGLFAFTASSFFNPYPMRLTAYTDLDAAGIDYVLARYNAPKAIKGATLQATATFDLADVRQGDNTVKFILSAPGIAAREPIIVRSIAVRFHKAPMSFADVLRTIVQRVL